MLAMSFSDESSVMARDEVAADDEHGRNMSPYLSGRDDLPVSF
jgi:hypothetical protein